MSKILTSTDYYIETCDFKYTLYKDLHKKDKNGVDVSKFMGDYTCLDQAMDALANRHLLDKLNEKESWTMEEIRILLSEIREDIKNGFRL